MTKAAHVLGVHPNTLRAWSDAGRLRFSRINERGDRRYRLSDLQRFLDATVSATPQGPTVTGLTASRTPRRVARHRAPFENPAGIELLADLAVIASLPSGLDAALADVCRRVRTAAGAALVGVWEQRPGGLVLRASAAEHGVGPLRRGVPPGGNAIRLALGTPQPVHARHGVPGPEPVLGLGTDELVVQIPGGERAWGVLVLAGAVELGSDDGRRLVMAIARTVGVIARAAAATEQASSRLRRSEALRRVATDLASRHDVVALARDLCDHARVLFGADRAAVALREGPGRTPTSDGIGFSPTFLAQIRELEERRADDRVPDRRPVQVVGGEAGRTASPLRSAGVQEGVDTLVVVPLVDDHELHGALYLGHDRPHAWREADLEAAEALAEDAAIAVRSARTVGRMAAWAAQLQSIQRLGARLSGLSSEREIGQAIATELRELIEYDNVRVYRVRGTDLVPVAWLGLSAEYVDERVEDLRLAVGEGITGWVAQHRVPQLVDNSEADPRAITIPGTAPDAEESMLLAPMVHEGVCLGVVVLAYGALRHFTEDDLRLLVIYAAFAAQAMANADSTERLREQAERLEHQLHAQRELLATTEAILTTLDASAVLDQITSRLGALIEFDNVAIQVIDGATGRLTPLTARGVDQVDYLQPWETGEQGLSTWVLEHNEPVLLEDELGDPRVARSPSGAVEGSMIAVPLLGPTSAAGVLILERLGRDRAFTTEEFDLVKLFAAQVSIALRNAEVFEAIEARAATDGLTGLHNHLAFRQQLARAIAADEPFGLVVIDLDRFRRFNEAAALHQDGDRVLREIAAAIRGAARGSDTVFRYGGDEFAVLLARSGTDGLAVAAARIHAAIRTVGGRGTRWAALGLEVTASIGTSSFPDDGLTGDEVLLAADRACRVAKLNGGDRVCTAREGLALAASHTLSEPTPVDVPTIIE